MKTWNFTVLLLLICVITVFCACENNSSNSPNSLHIPTWEEYIERVSADSEKFGDFLYMHQRALDGYIYSLCIIR